MSTEADTCRRFVLPRLYAAGWDDDGTLFCVGVAARIKEPRILEIMGEIKGVLAGGGAQS